MPLTLLSADGFDLLSGGIKCEAFDFPEAVPNDEGRRSQSASEDTDELEDAPWGLTLIVSGDSATEVATAVTDITRRFRTGMSLAVGLDDRPALAALVREVRCTGEGYFGTWARVSFTGTRDGAWYSDLKTLTPVTVPLWGSADITDVIDGDMTAQFSPRVICPLASTWLALGIKQDPISGYNPTDDYSGSVSHAATAYGGATTSGVTLSSTYTVIGTAPTIDGNANRGEHVVCVRGWSESAATKLKPASKLASLSTVEVVAPLPSTVGSATSMKGVVCSRVQVPAQDTPSGAAVESGWLPTETVAQQTSGTAVAVPQNSDPATTYANYTPYQTFTLTKRTRIRSVVMRGYHSGTSASCDVLISPVVDGFPTFDVIARTQAAIPSTVADFTANFDSTLAAGTYAAVLETSVWSGALYLVRNTDGTTYGGVGGHLTSTWVAGDGSDTTIDWYFKVNGQYYQDAGCTVSIRAAGSGVYALDVATRIPADDLAIVAVAAFSADQGFLYDPESEAVYQANSAGVNGNSVPANVYGDHKGLKPGATNTLVVAGDVGANAPGNVTVSGWYRERWRRLSRSA